MKRMFQWYMLLKEVAIGTIEAFLVALRMEKEKKLVSPVLEI